MSAWTPAAGPERLSVSRMISSLLGARPAGDAPAPERAAWLDRKAEVFTAIAGVNQAEGDVVNAAEARALATEARSQALTLTSEIPQEVAAGQHGAQADAADATAVTVRVDDPSEVPSRYLRPPTNELAAYDDGAGLP